ncbi:MAG TPA: DUF2073 domain-containing protein [Candidatus Omnitrophota bacterium]|nr:DUF2073 domain-containing protein [Candidatus Omnitrophota bacterium]
MAKKRGGKIGNLSGFSIQFLPYSEIRGLNSDDRIKKILDIILANNILILQGRLLPNEETRLIGDTMAMVGHIKTFKGVELAVISGNGNGGIFSKMGRGIANALAGGDFSAVTIVGPATVVKEIKRNPKKIELFLNR